MVITSGYDLASVQTLGEREESQTSACRGRSITIIAEVKFSISRNPLVSAVNHMAPRTFREKKNTHTHTHTHTHTKRVFFPLNVNVYINLYNRERAIARNK